MSKIFITGGTGFVGTALMPHLAARGHELVLLTRDSSYAADAPPQTKVVVGDPLQPGPWWEEVARCDAAVNLAGAPIVGRWTPQFKAIMRDSRILPTRHLVAAIPQGKPFTLFSASGIGIYGDGGEADLTEDSPHGTDFLARVAEDWEAEAMTAQAKGARVVIGRLALVLGRNGGALYEFFKNAKSFCSGPLAGGSQWVSWIRIDDAVDAITLLLESPDANGVYNIAATDPVRHCDLAKGVRDHMKVSTSIPIPRFMVRMVLGELSDNVLFSQRMVPKRLCEMGFQHRYPDLKENLRILLP